MLLNRLDELNAAYLNGRNLLEIDSAKIQGKDTKEFFEKIKEIVSKMLPSICWSLNISEDVTTDIIKSSEFESIATENQRKFNWIGNVISNLIQLIQKHKASSEAKLSEIATIQENFSNLLEPRSNDLLNILDQLESTYPDDIDSFPLIKKALRQKIQETMNQVSQSIENSLGVSEKEIKDAISRAKPHKNNLSTKEINTYYRNAILNLKELIANYEN